jgi:hypothetical protein
LLDQLEHSICKYEVDNCAPNHIFYSCQLNLLIIETYMRSWNVKILKNKKVINETLTFYTNAILSCTRTNIDIRLKIKIPVLELINI